MLPVSRICSPYSAACQLCSGPSWRTVTVADTPRTLSPRQTSAGPFSHKADVHLAHPPVDVVPARNPPRRRRRSRARRPPSPAPPPTTALHGPRTYPVTLATARPATPSGAPRSAPPSAGPRPPSAPRSCPAARRRATGSVAAHAPPPPSPAAPKPGRSSHRPAAGSSAPWREAARTARPWRVGARASCAGGAAVGEGAGSGEAGEEEVEEQEEGEGGGEGGEPEAAAGHGGSGPISVCTRPFAGSDGSFGSDEVFMGVWRRSLAKLLCTGHFLDHA